MSLPLPNLVQGVPEERFRQVRRPARIHPAQQFAHSHDELRGAFQACFQRLLTCAISGLRSASSLHEFHVESSPSAFRRMSFPSETSEEAGSVRRHRIAAAFLFACTTGYQMKACISAPIWKKRDAASPRFGSVVSRTIQQNWGQERKYLSRGHT